MLGPICLCTHESMSTWFSDHFGFDENEYTPAQLSESCFDTRLDESTGDLSLTAEVGSKRGTSFFVGRFETVSVRQLADDVLGAGDATGAGQESGAAASNAGGTDDEAKEELNDPTPLTSPDVRNLLAKQEQYLPEALRGLRATGRKVGHWAWYAFPTELKGMSEPEPKTSVTKHSADQLVANAPPVWRELLEEIAHQCKQSDAPSGVLPQIDHGRVKYFVDLWESLECSPKWLLPVCETLAVVFAGRSPKKAERAGGAPSLTFNNVTGNVQTIHAREAKPLDMGELCVIQAASQFNCLEMVGPRVTPSSGITQYFRDRTQGPACAQTCPASTFHRNYLADGGQCGTRQINTLRGCEQLPFVNNDGNKHWEMQNGCARARILHAPTHV